LTRMLNCPCRSAFNDSSRLPGGERSVSSARASSSISSLRAMTFEIARHRAGQTPSRKNRSVSSSAKPRITALRYATYHVLSNSALAQTHARPAAVLSEELHASGFQRGAHGSDSLRRDHPPFAFEIDDGRKAKGRHRRELGLISIEQRPRGPTLGGRHINNFC